MGMFKSICQQCGTEKKNSEMARCRDGCYALMCKEHFVLQDYVKKGVFKDKVVQHHICPICGYDNGTFIR